jgi:hypothetical protein
MFKISSTYIINGHIPHNFYCSHAWIKYMRSVGRRLPADNDIHKLGAGVSLTAEEKDERRVEFAANVEYDMDEKV